MAVTLIDPSPLDSSSSRQINGDTGGATGLQLSVVGLDHTHIEIPLAVNTNDFNFDLTIEVPAGTLHANKQYRITITSSAPTVTLDISTF